ncbi:hypothetical protein AX774_g1527 [Zancudomyces culisetae]|uniref:Uncharacterized protein n=1 Tax=Zancudomyces culisetae TaxID=1213189 RepID=A0A1R1PVC7_ZANCU|nr:hypothetical protein AX774_g1527 [Zancudomyces culisetae]|eukprot:OMH84937.1 hypothetical protein AX774_g1527 [Zancudomyces culisetae]
MGDNNSVQISAYWNRLEACIYWFAKTLNEPGIMYPESIYDWIMQTTHNWAKNNEIVILGGKNLLPS